MLRGFFGNLIFAIIARMLCGNHLKYCHHYNADMLFIFPQVLESVVKMIKDCWKQNAPARLSSLRVKKNLSKLMDMVKPAPSNTALSEEYAVISDVNIHIPETFIENHTSVKA